MRKGVVVLCVSDGDRDSQLLNQLTGEESSFLEIVIDEEGTLGIYEAYSEQGTDRLMKVLARLGIDARVVHRSLCG